MPTPEPDDRPLSKEEMAQAIEAEEEGTSAELPPESWLALSLLGVVAFLALLMIPGFPLGPQRVRGFLGRPDDGMSNISRLVDGPRRAGADIARQSGGLLQLERVMATHRAHLVLLSDPSTRLEVDIEFPDGKVTITQPKGTSLGSWPATELVARRIGPIRFDVTLAGERVFIDTADPLGFAAALESASQKSLRTRSSGRSAKRLPATGPSELFSTKPLEHRPTGASAIFLSKTTRQDEIVPLQQEVVEHVQLAMRAWFGYYFVLGEGTDRERLNAAAEDLVTASKRLFDVAAEVGRLSSSDQRGEPLLQYQQAVESWASAFESLASAALLDQQRAADDAFARLEDATSVARRVLDPGKGYSEREFVLEALGSLRDLRPPARVGKRTMQRAKAPWRRTIIAAGSALRWPESHVGESSGWS